MSRRNLIIVVTVVLVALISPYLPIHKLGGAGLFHCGYSKACVRFYGWGFRPDTCYDQFLVSPLYLLTGYGPMIVLDYEHCR